MSHGRNLKTFTFLVLTFFCVMSLSSSAIGEESVTDRYDIPIKLHQSHIQKLHSGIEIHLGKLQISGEKEFNLLAEIEHLDQNLALQKIRLGVMEERLCAQRELLTIKSRDLNEAGKIKDKVHKHLQERLRSFYLMGTTGVLNVTFSTRTLPELMLFNDSFTRMLEYDQAIVKKYRETIDQLVLAKDAHGQESTLLAGYIKNAVEEQLAMDAIREEKAHLLKRVKTQKGLYEQALKELKKAEADMLQHLAKLQKKRTYTLKGFAVKKGTLPAPVRGRVVTRFGDDPDKADDGSLAANGITIDASDGAPVRAIFSGTVLFAGYKRGYGNMIIIDHGLNYSSITSRIEKIAVKEDEKVNEGDIIGKAGDIATLFEKGIHFQIRHYTEPVDPLEWISPDGLTDIETASEKEATAPRQH